MDPGHSVVRAEGEGSWQPWERRLPPEVPETCPWFPLELEF